MIKHCLFCKKEYKTDKSASKLCSYPCAHAYRRSLPRHRTEVIKNCLHCGKVFKCIPADIKRGKAKYCSRECAVEFNTHKPIPVKCTGCATIFYRKRYRVYKNQDKYYCSFRCFLKNDSVFGKLKGKNHPSWKGGSSIKRNWSLNKAWRLLVFKRDNYKCVYCGSSKKLNADHLWPAWFVPEMITEVDNGQTLCLECHKKTLTWGTKSLPILKQIPKEKRIEFARTHTPIEVIYRTALEIKKLHPELRGKKDVF